MSGRGHPRQGLTALLAAADPGAHLHQFVIAERTLEFGLHAVHEAALPDQDHRAQRMAEAAEVSALSFVERHAAIIGRRPR